MPSIDQTVIVVDNHERMREIITALLNSVGFTVISFDSADSLLTIEFPIQACCLISDVRMPGRSGLDLQDHLLRIGVRLPIVFVTAYADVPITVRAMKAGAIDVLSKPFREQELLDAVQRAVKAGHEWRLEAEAVGEVRRRFESLTPREREILALVASGRLNKQIADDLGLTEITVKTHRGHVMRKMQARSLPELVRMADHIAPQPESSWAA